ncbi:MAG: acetate kinase [Clostridiales bacterium]|nr:acetate kinase [Clostridiales bacterium]MDD3540299.1 acetate kinase [Eubacteriales bacterium]MDD4186008.1 acetate kinase [Eubacteriales bacterium]MDY0119497.1 acetate kinase [Clostridia bacterium]NLG30389.1 acetate kinase [Clostridiaceae bacterium]
MLILVINSGSSSLKYQLINCVDRTVLAKGNCERIGIEDPLFKHEDNNGYSIKEPRDMKTHGDAVSIILETLLDPEHPTIGSLDEISAVGHRVVHGGPYFSEPVVVNEETKEAIRKCFDWCPLHNRANLLGIEVCEELMPGIPQVAVFDTAFHQSMPPEAYMYGIPYEYYEKHGVRRYGFHGTSHDYVARRAAQMTKHDPKTYRLITCHLGNGASFAAIKGGKCIDTSMGLTPLEGIMMGTRCGSIDPAIALFMARIGNYTPDEVDDILNKESGVLAISGVSSDFRDVQDAAAQGNERAQLAIDMFCYQAAKILGSYIAAMGGIETIVFTAGIGENDDIVRKYICDKISYRGLEIDEEKNKSRGKEVVLSTENSTIEVFVIPTNEEMAIAVQTAEVLHIGSCACDY